MNFMERKSFLTKYVYSDIRSDQAGSNLSWRAIFAGLVTFVAVSLLFSLIGAAIGFGVPTFNAADPFAGVTVGLVLWIVFSLIVALAAAGFVAGITANRAGFVHGFLTWALSVITVFFLAGAGVNTAFKTVGNILGLAGEAVGSTIQTAGGAVANLSQEAFDAAVNNLEVDTSQLDSSVKEVLADTDIPELQPNYIQSQLEATVEDTKSAGYEVVVNGADAGQVIDDLTSKIQARIDNITAELDEDALAEVIASNSELTKTEAQDAIANIAEEYNKATEQAAQALNDAQTRISQLANQASASLDQAADVAEDVSDEVAKYSLYIFAGLLVAGLITSFTGYAGAKAVREYDVEI